MDPIVSIVNLVVALLGGSVGSFAAWTWARGTAQKQATGENFAKRKFDAVEQLILKLYDADNTSDPDRYQYIPGFPKKDETVYRELEEAIAIASLYCSEATIEKAESRLGQVAMEWYEAERDRREERRTEHGVVPGLTPMKDMVTALREELES